MLKLFATSIKFPTLSVVYISKLLEGFNVGKFLILLNFNSIVLPALSPFVLVNALETIKMS